MHDSLPPSSIPTDEIKRDADIWFEDGNIIVIAQDTAFHFHKGVLSHHSQVFRNLFLIPQPLSSGASTIDILDGCPTIRVSDTSYDFQELLHAIYGGVSYLHPDRSVTFPVLAALRHLAHKYQLDQLLEAVVCRLKASFMTRLDAWDCSGSLDPTCSPLRLYRGHAIEVLNLFHLLDKPKMVPIALYGCCQLQPKALIRGVHRVDGISLEYLSPDNLEACVAARERLVCEMVRLLSHLCGALETRILEAASDERCPSPFICVVDLKTWLDEWQKFPYEYMDEDPLDNYYMTKLNEAVDDETLCSTCGEVIRQKLVERRNEIWMSLPDLLGLPRHRRPSSPSHHLSCTPRLSSTQSFPSLPPSCSSHLVLSPTPSSVFCCVSP